MKLYFLLLSFFITFTYASSEVNELSWVDEQVNAIKPPRKGVDERKIAKLSDPFIFLKKNSLNSEEEEKPTKKSKQKNTPKYTKSSTYKKVYRKKSVSSKHFKLGAIVNDTAFINGQWYKLHDKIKGYKVMTIKKATVVLTKKGKKIMLSIHKKNKNIKFKTQ